MFFQSISSVSSVLAAAKLDAATKVSFYRNAQATRNADGIFKLGTSAKTDMIDSVVAVEVIDLMLWMWGQNDKDPTDMLFSVVAMLATVPTTSKHETCNAEMKILSNVITAFRRLVYEERMPSKEIWWREHGSCVLCSSYDEALEITGDKQAIERVEVITIQE